jgi:hypothetical protein
MQMPKNPNSCMHISNVSIISVQSLERVRYKCERSWLHKVGTILSTDAGKIMFNYICISQKMSRHFQSHKHIFNVSTRTVQSLEKASQEVQEKLITQSQYMYCLLAICWKKWQSSIFEKMFKRFQRVTCTALMCF